MTGRKTTRRSRLNSSYFWVTKTSGAVVALPEFDARALGVAVPRARAEALLLLVVAAKEELHDSGEEEKECTKNGDSKASRVKATCSAKRHRVGDSSALGCRCEILPLSWAGPLPRGVLTLPEHLSAPSRVRMAMADHASRGKSS